MTFFQAQLGAGQNLQTFAAGLGLALGCSARFGTTNDGDVDSGNVELIKS